MLYVKPQKLRRNLKFLVVVQKGKSCVRDPTFVPSLSCLGIDLVFVGVVIRAIDVSSVKALVEFEMDVREGERALRLRRHRRRGRVPALRVRCSVLFWTSS